jgi:hypothetical protein
MIFQMIEGAATIGGFGVGASITVTGAGGWTDTTHSYGADSKLGAINGVMPVTPGSDKPGDVGITFTMGSVEYIAPNYSVSSPVIDGFWILFDSLPGSALGMPASANYLPAEMRWRKGDASVSELTALAGSVWQITARTLSGTPSYVSTAGTYATLVTATPAPGPISYTLTRLS